MNPPNISPSDLLSKIIATPRANAIVDFPRNDSAGEPICQIGIVILTEAEISAANSAAEKRAKKALGALVSKDEESKGYDDIYASSRAVELLLRALKDPNDLKRPFFTKSEQISENLTGDEIGILLNNYITLQATSGPIISHLTEEEMEAWIVKLAQGGKDSQHFLDLFSGVALKALMTTMASQLMSYKTDNSSLSLPLDE